MDSPKVSTQPGHTKLPAIRELAGQVVAPGLVAPVDAELDASLSEDVSRDLVGVFTGWVEPLGPAIAIGAVGTIVTCHCSVLRAESPRARCPAGRPLPAVISGQTLRQSRGGHASRRTLNQPRNAGHA